MIEVTFVVSIVALILSGLALCTAPEFPRACATHGHKFQGRYHSAPTLDSVDRGSAEDIAELLRASKSMTYVHDVCVFCGEIRKIEHQ